MTLRAAGFGLTMAIDAVTAAVIGAVALVFFLMFLFVRRIITSFSQGYRKGR
jgi:ABC-type multidrug transport system permease subunit